MQGKLKWNSHDFSHPKVINLIQITYAPALVSTEIQALLEWIISTTLDILYKDKIFHKCLFSFRFYHFET